MNFELMFFAYDQMSMILIAILGVGSPLTSPLWFVLEGRSLGRLSVSVRPGSAGRGLKSETPNAA